MSRGSRATWWIFAVCALAVLLTLGWISRTMLQLEDAERLARHETRQREQAHLALSHLESWFLPHVTREASRPYFEYLPYHAVGRNYTRLLNEIEQGEVLRPSPLLTVKPPFTRLHFQVAGDGQFTSPQVPDGNLRDLAEATCLAVDAVPTHQVIFQSVHTMVDVPTVLARVKEAERRQEQILGDEAGRLLPDVVLPGDGQLDLRQAQVEQTQWAQRAKSNAQAQKQAVDDANLGQVLNGIPNDFADAPLDAVEVGPLVPLWLGPEANELFLFRRVTVGDEALLQGVFLDWPGLRTALLEEARAFLEPEDLVPVRTVGPRETDALACIPARLTVKTPPAPPAGPWSPARATLGVTWFAVLASLLVVGIALRRSLELGERRSRFASAVTHELRTPLTTFRLYSEMLADGMVQDPEQRQSYLETLRQESARLASLVENVLAYARLEDRRAPPRRVHTTAGELCRQVLPPLERRARDSDVHLVVQAPAEPSPALEVDQEMVGQILFNLVDNACKYAEEADPRRVEVSFQPNGAHLHVRVRDHGPGIPEHLAGRIFHPFERAGREQGTTPGLGLGLPLARGLARDLGGELTVQSPPDGAGALFELALPLEAGGPG